MWKLITGADIEVTYRSVINWSRLKYANTWDYCCGHRH